MRVVNYFGVWTPLLLIRIYRRLMLKIFFNVYFWERERESERASMSGGGAERERETQNPKQVPGSEPSAQSPTWGSNPRILTSWPEPKPEAQSTEPPRCPSYLILILIPALSFNSVFFVTFDIVCNFSLKATHVVLDNSNWVNMSLVWRFMFI